MSLVLQVPLMFNNNIMENILYGNAQAKTSEIKEAAATANCDDFLEMGQLFRWDFTAESMLQTMRDNKAAIVKRIGERRYEEELAVLERLEIQEDVEGVFEHVCIDRREEGLKDVDLGPGFYQQVGVDGCKLSLDQAQRLSIARAIVFKPKVLLVDDAILGRNERGAQKVRTALENAMKDITAILFTEKANYASRMVAKLFVVEHGKIVEKGTFAELKAEHGVLTRLIMNE